MGGKYLECQLQFVHSQVHQIVSSTFCALLAYLLSYLLLHLPLPPLLVGYRWLRCCSSAGDCDDTEGKAPLLLPLLFLGGGGGESAVARFGRAISADGGDKNDDADEGRGGDAAAGSLKEVSLWLLLIIINHQSQW